ncbi:hypothetical protein N6H14_03915 [Paenibacillus sp. CC-CFT747]|nr:hypothetical protein N6H14_03915 [Paenibacillus sp. CC-CFT747]
MSNWGAFAGLFSGALMGLAGLWLGRYFAAKKRGLDERYYAVWRNARAASWIITMAALYVLFFLLLAGVSLSALAALGILMLVHFTGWALSGLYYQTRM